MYKKKRASFRLTPILNLIGKPFSHAFGNKQSTINHANSQPTLYDQFDRSINEFHENDSDLFHQETYTNTAELNDVSKSLAFINKLEDFSIEGFMQLGLNGSNLNSNSEYDVIENIEIIEIDNEMHPYKNFFYGTEHFNFIGKSEDEDFLISIKLEANRNEHYVRYVLRSKNGNTHGKIFEAHIYSITGLLNQIDQSLLVKEIKPIQHPFASDLLIDYDKNLIKNKFTFAIVYQKKGQDNEKDILSNLNHGKKFQEFLEFIGEKIKLKAFEGYRGGLDVSNNSTGEHSIYSSYEDFEIMFHVSTMLPFSEKDDQQLERKRHIGNDRVAIVFQEDDTLFLPSMLNSKLLHAFLVIQPHVSKENEDVTYKITMLYKHDVPYFNPFIRKPYVFLKNENLKRFLIAKLINAEYAILQSESFRPFIEKAIKPNLTNLYKALASITIDFCGLNESEKSNENTYNHSNIRKLSGVQSTINNKMSNLKHALNSIKKSQEFKESKLLPLTLIDKIHSIDNTGRSRSRSLSVFPLTDSFNKSNSELIISNSQFLRNNQTQKSLIASTRSQRSDSITNMFRFNNENNLNSKELYKKLSSSQPIILDKQLNPLFTTNDFEEINSLENWIISVQQDIKNLKLKNMVLEDLFKRICGNKSLKIINIYDYSI